ncbi:molybdopterin-dependent oxidoreductase [Chloroflexota bacterium]
MVDKAKPVKGAGEEKTAIKGLGFCALCVGSNTSEVDSRDGRIIRIRPFHFDRKYKPEEFVPWKMEARGKTFEPGLKSLIPPLSLGYKKRVYSPNRILYPLKRVDFDPNGERNVENRGKSGYVRISWDEALDIVVSEIKRVKEKYGLYSVLIEGDGHGESKVVHGCHGCHQRLFDLMGEGYTETTRSSDSWEGWYYGAKHVWGMEPLGMQMDITNGFPDIAENSDMLLHWGCDAETTPWGWGGQMPSRLCYWFTELGIKQIFISPDLNYAAAVHADKWIPVLPNTDAALQLALAYVWMTEETYDKDYVATHAVGFEKFEDYVLGKEDGVPKTPAWAAERCGVPSRTIKALAREWATKVASILHCNGGSYIRAPYAHEPGRLEVLLLAMQGLGKPGAHQMKFLDWGMFGLMEQVPIPRGKLLPEVRAAYRGWKFKELQKQFLPRHLLTDAILKPPISWYGTPRYLDPVEYQFMQYSYPAEGCSEIHMIWSDMPCQIGCWLDTNSYIKALRNPKIEFFLVQHPWFENDCLLADVILPVNTKLEEEDLEANNHTGQYNVIHYEERCIEPLGESKSDYEICCLVAERLGILKEYTGGKTVGEWIKYGFENSGVQDLISYEEWKEKGYYVVPTDPDWGKYPVGMTSFYQDPENNPLGTPSGKIEFYSERLDIYFPDDKERPPVPGWIERSETHDERRGGDRARKYPLLIVSNHPRWRIHVQHDDITWLREIPTCKVRGPDGYQYEPVWINPQDAARRGIKDGDVVKLYNERGAVLGGAYLTEKIIPGAISMDHGARYDPIVLGELDRGGSNNTLTPHNTTSKNVPGIPSSGFLIEIERANLDDLRKQYPEAFNRPFHPDSGPNIETFLYGGKEEKG